MHDHEGFITKPRKRKWSPSQHHGLDDFYADRKSLFNITVKNIPYNTVKYTVYHRKVRDF